MLIAMLLKFLKPLLDGNLIKRGRQASHLARGYKEGEPVKDGPNANLVVFVMRLKAFLSPSSG